MTVEAVCSWHLTDENHLVYTPLLYLLSMPAPQEQRKPFRILTLQETDIRMQLPSTGDLIAGEKGTTAIDCAK